MQENNSKADELNAVMTQALLQLQELVRFRRCYLRRSLS